MNAEHLTSLAQKAYPNVPAFPRSNPPSFHSPSAPLFLDFLKFKKSIEEQMLNPLFLPQMAVSEREKGAIEC
jgi:hypothetical protein